MKHIRHLYILSGLVALLANPCMADTVKNQPLVAERIVFNWHNFLSGCSTWNLEDWTRWTEQSQKMGCNAIMVHAYGNNPMAAFSFKGVDKPVGYLSTTAKGRDWNTMHVNDVRSLVGGGVFDGPVFGADAGMVPDAQRVDAAKALMNQVFAHAKERNMGVFFAIDVDTPSANPQKLVTLLPESARFKPRNSGLWLPNPDTPEGYAYFQAQVADLLKSYPQITTLTVWFRADGTPWVNLKPEDLPEAWRKEYASEIARTPEAGKFWNSAGLFAIGKIVAAYERARKEIGADSTRIAAGTWRFQFLPAADRFFPKGVPLIGLDYEVLHNQSRLATAKSRAELAEIGARRPVIPVIWAHHDDGHYAGRSYTPFSDFHTKLVESKAAGFGVIHWTTRPMDLFFAAHIRQVFSGTKDEPLRTTCELFAKENLGEPALREYLHAWITEAPQFGRETSDYFIDRPLANVSKVVEGCRKRLALIGDTKGQHADYFRGMEQFVASFYETHDLFQRSRDALNHNDIGKARELMGECDPEGVIEKFAKFSSIGGITRGEQGLIVTMNLRWLTHIIRHRQALGLEPVRIKFGPTQHDPLAQSPGTFTFHADEKQKIWEVWGERECGARVFSNPDAKQDLARTGIKSDKPLSFKLRPIMAVDSRNTSQAAFLPVGKYCLRLLLLDPESTTEGQRLCKIEVAGPAHTQVHEFDRNLRNESGGNEGAPVTVDVFKEAGGSNRLWAYEIPVTVRRPGSVTVTLTPVKGPVLICGMDIKPLDTPATSPQTIPTK